MTPGDEERAAAFDAAERDAKVVVEASAAAFGATEADASERDNVVVLLRITGPGPARQCGHLSGPTTVYLHSATRVHMCSECASSAPTVEAIEEHMPIGCDSCGDQQGTLSLAQFTVTNVVVTAYICNRCQDGRQSAVVPDWVGRHPRS